MDPRTILVICTILGAVVTLYGLTAAWIGAHREFDEMTTFLAAAERIASKEDLAENATEADRAAFEEERRALYARHKMTETTWGNISFVAAYESRRLLGLVLTSTRRDFLVAAAGLVISTASSVASLFLSA